MSSSKMPILNKAAACAGAGLVGGALLLAAGPSIPSIPLFAADFNATTLKLVASVGSIYAFVTDQNAVQITAEIGSGNQLVIDDSYSTSGVATAIACGFQGQKIIHDGVFSYSSEITLGSSDLPFQTGIVIDAPQSDMVPATGPDDDGILLIGGESTSQVVPAGVELDVYGTFSRQSANEDWYYSVVVVERNPPEGEKGFYASGEGRFEGTANRPIVGIAFRKQTGNTGAVSIDDIHAEYSPPVSAPKKR